MHALRQRHCAQLHTLTFTLCTAAPIRDLSFKRACAISGTRGTDGIGSVNSEAMEGNNRQLNFRSRVVACMLRHHGLTASPQWAFNTLRNKGSWLNCRWCLSDCCDVVRCLCDDGTRQGMTFHDIRTRQHSKKMDPTCAGHLALRARVMGS